MRVRSVKEKKLFYTLLFAVSLILDIVLISYIRSESESMIRLDAGALMQAFRNQQIPEGFYEQCIAFERDGGTYDRYAYLFGYVYSGLTDEKELSGVLSRLKERYPLEYERFTGYERAVWSQPVLFPVAESVNHVSNTVAFEDSWMQSRTFGGERGHEGCDIMASLNVRGHYPIVSVSDGVIEKIGWLTQGGYRIGVRSEGGAYYYYTHLYDYARDFTPGDRVRAGELLGFMGDSGYSEVEGTVGNFDVHLHFGIYLNDENGTEFSVNSYCILKYLEDKKMRCVY